jgi:glutathione S-transferase
LYTLYYSPGACSFAAHIVLREIVVPFELKRITLAKSENRTPEFLAINPLARVPVLVVEDQPITELSGILTWLGQQSGLFPATGTLDAIRCSEWLAWLTSSVHISFAQIWRGERFSADRTTYDGIRAYGLATLAEQFASIEKRLSGKTYALGETYSVVDPNLLVFYRWGGRVGFDMRGECPVWTRHAEHLLERPAVQAAIAEEGIEIWPEADTWARPVA